MQLVRGEFERTASHWWWRPGWERGRRYLTVHLTFGVAPELVREAECYLPALSGRAGVDVVPVPWLHLTMTGIGFVDEMSPDALEEVALRVLGADATPSSGVGPLVLDTLFLGREGLALTGPLPGWLAVMKAAQERAVGEVLGVERPAAAFHPHVSLAYFDAEIDEPGLVAAVHEVGLRDVEVRTPTLSVLELGRDEHVYTWRVIRERVLELGG